jgi:beta-glucosidase
MPFVDSAPHAMRLEYAHRAPMFGAGVHLVWQPEAVAMRDQAVQIAGQADVVVAFVGLSPSLEGEEMPVQLDGFHGGDRTKIGLPQLQQDLLQAVAATGKPLVVVLMNGSALAVPWVKEHAAAILEAWYPGEEGGAAIAETLAGDNNPAGTAISSDSLSTASAMVSATLPSPTVTSNYPQRRSRQETL